MALKLNEIRSLTKDELEAKYQALVKDLFTLNQEAKMGKLEKPDKIRQTRKNIARILTILREKGVKL
ncbi:MAG: 50S ribosomal protein L29 [Candidatus Omnitrophota bacterium]